MVDVTHDRDDRPARCGARGAIPLHRFELDGLFERHHFGVNAELLGDLERQIGAEGLVDREHQALFHQKVLHQIVGLDSKLVGQLLDRRSLAERDLVRGPVEVENLARHRGGLFADVAAVRRNPRLPILVCLQHGDVGPEVIVNDLRSGERALCEQLVVDFGRALALAAFARGLLLGRRVFTSIRTPRFAASHRAARQRPGKGRRRRRRAWPAAAGAESART